MNPFTDFMDTLLDGVLAVVAVITFLRYPWPPTLIAYVKSIAYGTVKIFPALAVFLSGQTTISQEPVRKPDEHFASQVQHGPEMEMEEALLSVPGGSPNLDGMEITTETGILTPQGGEAVLQITSPPSLEKAH
jgi:hypothetical protein